MFGFYRVATCSPVVKVADAEFNTARILELAEKAAAHSASVVLFPELAVTAYSCGDLFHNETLLNAAEHAVSRIAEKSASLPSVFIVGAPVRRQNRLFNAAVVIQHGRLCGIVPKTNLPNYREFYEKRYFSSGYGIRNATADFAGQTEIPFGTDLIFRSGSELVFGIEICEDMWSTVPPSSYLALNGATLILNPSASNELVGKADYRRELVRGQSARCVAAYAYVSAGVSESTMDTVCGGHSIAAENGTVLLDSERFSREDALYVTDFDLARIQGARLSDSPFANSAEMNPHTDYRILKLEPAPVPELKEIERKVPRLPFVPSSDAARDERCQEIFAIQSAGLAKRIEHTHAEKAVIGISGGLDSTLALLVCVNTMKLIGRTPEDVLAITMPGFGTTGRTYNNAVNLCRLLGVELREIGIKDACMEHFRSIGHDPEDHSVVYENAQARERTQILMDVANQAGGFVVGTGDLSEIAMGWCTYNADHMSMYGVNSGVPKTLVRWVIQTAAENEAFSSSRECLQSILDTPISPELLPPDEKGNILQQTEDVVGPYALHDFFLYYAIRFGYPPKKVFDLCCIAFEDDFSCETILKWLKNFYRRFWTQQFKRNCMPDGVKIGSIALSPRGDWRMPSDAQYKAWMDECDCIKA